jgi:hypothetical protein
MPLVGFKPTILASEQPQTYALDCMPLGLAVSDDNTLIFHKKYHIFQKLRYILFLEKTA